MQEVQRKMEDLRIDKVDSRLWESNEHQWLEEFDIVMEDGLRTDCSRFEYGEESKEHTDMDKLVDQFWHGDSPDEPDVVAEKSTVPVIGGVLRDHAEASRDVCKE